MIKIKKIGIWMDHSSAHLIDATEASVKSIIIKSKFTHQIKEDSLEKSERLMHNKEQHEQSEYYKKLSEIIRNYDDVILFGPTDAKAELLNSIRADHLFGKIKIEIKQTDKMTENQEQAFVRGYFSK